VADVDGAVAEAVPAGTSVAEVVRRQADAGIDYLENFIALARSPHSTALTAEPAFES